MSRASADLPVAFGSSSGASTLRVAARVLMGMTWSSTGLFGLYMLAFYGRAVAEDAMTRWNSVLPGLYSPGAPAATAGIGLHFGAGGLILVLGCVQLLPWVRTRWPAVHRWIGRAYVLAALCAGIGGLAFIALRGTVGGTVMDVGFGLYGVLIITAAAQAWRHGYARRLQAHRAWGLRLFALAVGSWLYRMDFGIWFMLAHGAGHAAGFSGPFDKVMAFFFYLPNLVIVELYLHGRNKGVEPAMRWITASAMFAASGLLAVGTYYFTLYSWGPGILGRIP